MRLLRLAALVLLGPSPRTEARAKKKADVWGSGGWPVAPGGGAKGDGEGDECTIARKTACRTDGGKRRKGCLSPEEFERSYSGRRPVILKGLLDGWPARERWRRREFVEAYGAAPVHVGTPAEHVFNGPQDAAASLPLANVTRLIESDKNLFVFDTQELFRSELGQRLGEDFAAPAGWSSLEELHANDATTDRGGRKGWHMLSLGGDGAGLGWHVHGASWLGLVFGEKRWFVYRPGQATLAERGHPLHSAADWIATGPAEGAAQPLTCTQRAGELFYLPAGWPHLTSNRGTALGAGGQAPVRSMEEFGALRTGAEAGDPQAQVFVGMALLHQHQVREENQVKLPTPLRMLAAAAASHPLELNARKNNAEGQFLLTREEAGAEAVADYAAALKAAERHLVPSDAFEALLAQLHLTDKHRELLAQEEVADVETLSSLSEEDLTSVPGIPALAQRIEEEGEMGGRVCPHMLLAKGYYGRPTHTFPFYPALILFYADSRRAGLPAGAAAQGAR